MGARQKLNTAAVNGSLVVAAIIGYVMQSWIVFFLAFLFLLASALYVGQIRPGSRR